MQTINDELKVTYEERSKGKWVILISCLGTEIPIAVNEDGPGMASRTAESLRNFIFSLESGTQRKLYTGNVSAWKDDQQQIETNQTEKPLEIEFDDDGVVDAEIIEENQAWFKRFLRS